MAWDDNSGAAEPVYDSFTIDADDRDRLRSMLGPAAPAASSPAVRREPGPIEPIEPTVYERLDLLDRKLDKLLDDGAAIDDLRAEVARLTDRLEQLTALLATRSRQRSVRLAGAET